MTDDFLERLSLLSELRGLTNAEVARRTGMDPSTTHRWLHGGGYPKDRGAVVAKVFGLDLAAFYALDLATIRIELEAKRAASEAPKADEARAS